MAKIKIARKEYRMLFNLNAFEAINEKYGSLDELQKVLLLGADKIKEQIEAFAWIITLFVNQAILSRNIDIREGLIIGEEQKPISEEYVKTKLKVGRYISQKQAVFLTISEDSNFSTDDEEEIDEVLAEIDSKKA